MIENRYSPYTEGNADPITVNLENSEKCRRYSAFRAQGVTVTDSPAWLVESLKDMGQKSINNIVDATNYVMFDIGQPLHAFDAEKIAGNKVVVKTLADKTKFSVFCFDWTG